MNSLLTIQQGMQHVIFVRMHMGPDHFFSNFVVLKTTTLKINTMALTIGSKAPDFTLINTEKKEASLKDFAGKTLVINFFPAAFTGVCTEQMCSNRDQQAYYNNIGATVVGVSVDMPFTLGIFKSQNNINFDLLSDFNKKMIRDYDMYLEDFTLGLKGVAKRGVTVIDGSGMVVYAEETANPGTQVNFAALKDALGKLS